MGCFENENIRLDKAVVPMHNYNNSNCKQHIKSKHSSDLFGRQYTAQNNENTKSEGSNVSKSLDSAASGGTESRRTSYQLFKKTDPKLINRRTNELQLAFMQSMNIAARHGRNQDLQRFLEHVVDHSHYYIRNKGSLLMGRTKLLQQRYASFDKFIKYVERLVVNSRLWFQKQTKTEKVPFITVAHDGWDSKDKDMLGVSIHLINVVLAKKVTIAVGLQQLCSKKSVDVAEHILTILQR
jgi:hypothetical protein